MNGSAGRRSTEHARGVLQAGCSATDAVDVILGERSQVLHIGSFWRDEFEPRGEINPRAPTKGHVVSAGPRCLTVYSFALEPVLSAFGGVSAAGGVPTLGSAPRLSPIRGRPWLTYKFRFTYTRLRPRVGQSRLARLRSPWPTRSPLGRCPATMRPSREGLHHGTFVVGT